jgi:Protein of unknown function (Ytp1)
MLLLLVQALMGGCLWIGDKRSSRYIPKFVLLYARTGHGGVGRILVLLSWIQIVLGGVNALGFCSSWWLSQCVTHSIFGIAYIAYGSLWTIILLVGQRWLRNTGRSQEFFDSVNVAAWGLVNTFTEHRWGYQWDNRDIQHTSMGVLWLCSGLLGIWLSRSKKSGPNVIPGITFIVSGWALAAHAQDSVMATEYHQVLGSVMAILGACRILEASFLTTGKGFQSSKYGEMHTFRYLSHFVSPELDIEGNGY